MLLLQQSVVVNVTGYGLGATTLSQFSLLKLGREDSVVTRGHSAGNNKRDISSGNTFWDLPSVEICLEGVASQSILKVIQNSKNSIHQNDIKRM